MNNSLRSSLETVYKMDNITTNVPSAMSNVSSASNDNVNESQKTSLVANEFNMESSEEEFY
jgi:hypothetical protein